MEATESNFNREGFSLNVISGMEDNQYLSVVIITLNEERNIGRCIDSVLSIADEILVLDSFSTDQTVAIAASRGARVVQERFPGHIQQKNRALQLAKYNMVLSLDADEALDDNLLNSITAVKDSLAGRAFTMNRCTNYCGKFIRHGLWYPDRKLRLFDKRLVHWGGTNPHDKIIPDAKLKPRHLKGDMLHYSYYSIEEHLQKNNYFSSIAANVMYTSGKPFRIWKLFLNPSWSFINGYMLRAGFLDGIYGFLIAIQSAHYTFLKYNKLRQLHRQKPWVQKEAAIQINNVQGKPLKRTSPA
jgi:glycosyltransferase involved in cell wall biosynthesis